MIVSTASALLASGAQTIAAACPHKRWSGVFQNRAFAMRSGFRYLFHGTKRETETKAMLFNTSPAKLAKVNVKIAPRCHPEGFSGVTQHCR